MSYSSQDKTFEQLQMSEVRENTPDQLIKGAPQPQPAVNNSWKFNIRRCMFLIFMVISSSILLSQINAQDDDLPIEPNKPFQFYVYCPYYYNDKRIPFEDWNQGSNDYNQEFRRRRLFTQYSNEVKLKQKDDTYDFKNTYVVEMHSTNDSGKPQLYYCGLATKYYTTCDQVVDFKCSSPGPMFDLKVNQMTDIIWINNLDQKYYPATTSGCMFNQNDPHCELHSKPDGSPQMTYTDPTNNETHLESSKRMIKPKYWPASTHVHGAEVRPTFDGNPLSWFDNSGNRGIGAFSLSDKCYYDSFDKNDNLGNYYMPPEFVVTNKQKNTNAFNRAKISRYPNIQNPGNLWYHDHAMRLTQYNVQFGLAGNYILRDDRVTAQIGVSRNNQKLVMLTAKGWNTSQLELNSDTVYRFRFLNNNYAGGRGGLYNISFANGTCNSSQTIPFTIIGADSSLFHQGIYKQTSFVVAQAERIELLIIFSSSIANYSICETNGNFQFQDIPIKKIKKDQTTIQSRTSIDNVTLPVDFVDFTSKGSLVAVKRMRPLSKLGSGPFAINGRASFHQGKSENPTIGTYQDWYLINGMSSAHPIHIHLINFQVVKILSLRLISNKCTVYELDFVAKAIFNTNYSAKFPQVFPDPKDARNINYTALCTNLSDIYNQPGIDQELNKVNLEDQIDPVTKVSGINVEIKLDQYDTKLFQKLGIDVSDSEYKYYTTEKSISKPYYKRFKDTANVEGFQAFVFRMRWAKSSYVDGSNDPNYFHVPIDQLREYPGFVYHCHILGHEDNEMMRPIMLQLPKDAKLDPSIPCNNGSDYSWEKKVQCINKNECKDGKY